MTIVESIRNFILTCPFLADGHVRIDYLGANSTEYTIDSVPCTEVVKKYIDGSCIKQHVFVFASRESYGANELQNIENSGFYEKFAAWLKEQTEINSLPILQEGKKAQKIEAQSTGYLISSTPNEARYQVQCRLVYFEGGIEE